MKKMTDYASGNFLKAINVQSEKDAFVVTEIEEVKANDKEVLRLTLEKDGVEYDFDLNKTNAKFLAGKGIIEPMTLMSKKLFFRKALVRNPKTNQEVEGLRICDLQ